MCARIVHEGGERADSYGSAFLVDMLDAAAIDSVVFVQEVLREPLQGVGGA